MRINRENYGGNSLPPLRVEALEGKSAAILTISSASEGNIPDFNAPGGQRRVLRMTFDEFPENTFYVNPAGVTACVEEFGEYTEQWLGKRLPLTVRDVLNPVTHKEVPALHVAPLAEWEGIFDGTGVVADTAAKKSPARKAARKSGRK